MMRRAGGGDRHTGMAVYFFLFAAGMSAYVSFVTMWQHSIGYSNLRIGSLSAASAAAAILLQPALSLAADRQRSKNAVLRVLLAVQSAAAFMHIAPGPWPWVLAAMSALTAFQSAALGLSTAVILDNLKSQGREGAFGGIRLSYSWGFAAAGLAAGFVASRSTVLVFALCGALNLLALAASFLLPGAPGYQKTEGRRMGIRQILGYREFRAYLGYSLVLHTTHSLAVAFLPVYFTSLGAPGWAYGIGVFVMAAAETPFLLASGRLIGRFGMRTLLVIPGVAFTLRWFLTAAATQWWQLVALYALHGLGIIVVYVVLARYVCDCLPKELSASGQGAVNAAVVSASRVAGALLGGVLVTWLGMRQTFLIMGITVMLAALALAVCSCLVKSRKNAC